MSRLILAGTGDSPGRITVAFTAPVPNTQQAAGEENRESRWLSPNHQSVLDYMAERWGERSWFFASAFAMSEDTGIPLRTVYRALDRMIELDIIARSRRDGGRGTRYMWSDGFDSAPHRQRKGSNTKS